MLNKDICKKCYLSKYKSHHADMACIAERFEERWENGKLLCIYADVDAKFFQSKKAGNSVAWNYKVTEKPPEHCVYGLEQLMYVEADSHVG